MSNERRDNQQTQPAGGEQEQAIEHDHGGEPALMESPLEQFHRGPEDERHNASRGQRPKHTAEAADQPGQRPHDGNEQRNARQQCE